MAFGAAVHRYSIRWFGRICVRFIRFTVVRSVVGQGSRRGEYAAAAMASVFVTAYVAVAGRFLDGPVAVRAELPGKKLVRN